MQVDYKLAIFVLIALTKDLYIFPPYRPLPNMIIDSLKITILTKGFQRIFSFKQRNICFA